MHRRETRRGREVHSGRMRRGDQRSEVRKPVNCNDELSFIRMLHKVSQEGMVC